MCSQNISSRCHIVATKCCRAAELQDTDNSDIAPVQCPRTHAAATERNNGCFGDMIATCVLQMLRHVVLALLVLLLCQRAAGLSTSATTQDVKPLFAPAVDPGGRLYDRMAGLVVPYGYPLEEHFVETIDGYILRLFRIPHGRTDSQRTQQQQQQQQQQRPRPRQQWSRRLSWLWNKPYNMQQQQQQPRQWSRRLSWLWNKPYIMQQQQQQPRQWSRRLSWLWNKPYIMQQQQQQPRQHSSMRPVVHLQHGLLDSSTGWVLNGPGFSLPFILADQGYDVWLGNVRGNIFSRNHTTLDILAPQFWSFSWDEMAERDLPAMLTHELLTTGAAEVAYVGHSQGTTIGMAFMSSHANSALTERIKVAVLLAPVAFVTHVDSIPLATLATLSTDQIFTLLGIHEFLPSSEILSKLEGHLCWVQPALCVNILAAICGYNPTNLDQRRLPTYLNYTPSGTSVQNMAHWSQQVRSPGEAVVRRFDYGTSCRTLLDTPRPCNQAVYGELIPPAYNLSAINNQLVLFTGGKDRLSDPKDLELLLKVLPTDQILLHQHYPDYEHLDFLWGINAAGWVYRKLLGILEELQQ